MNIIQWMIENRIAQNHRQAANIANGLKLIDLPDDTARIERVTLYRRWRPKTDRKNQLPTWQAFELAIAGIDPAGVVDRQMFMSMTDEDWQEKIHADLMNTGEW